MMNKKGEGVNYLIISLILGILVLSLALYFIFQEYFNDDEMGLQVCRESVLARSGAFANGVKLVQEQFPFKCKTQVLEINYEDKEAAAKLIADSLAQCWYTFGEGNKTLYSQNVFEKEHICFHCSRIHFSDKVKDYYTEDNAIPIAEYLSDENFLDGQPYSEYLWNSDYDQIVKTFPMVLDSRNGDIIVSFVYGKSAIFSFAKPGQTAIFFQPSIVEPKCDEIATVPA